MSAVGTPLLLIVGAAFNLSGLVLHIILNRKIKEDSSAEKSFAGYSETRARILRKQRSLANGLL